MRLRLAGLGMALCSVAEAGEPGSRAAAPAASFAPATPLRTLSSTPAPIGDIFAWAAPALCDESGNTYFLVVPPITSGRKQEPRAVLRVSADGKRRFSFTAASVSRLARRDDLRTISFALDPDGGLFMLVWDEVGGHPEASGQYILSFDENGEYRAHFEVDWHEILVQQLEVFGSGQFLLHGRRPDRPEPRLAVLSANGGELRDVIGWSGRYKPLEEPSPRGGGIVQIDPVARGSDGRVYLAELDARQGEDVVYAFRPSGEARELFTLRPRPRATQLLGWKVAGHRFAASYVKAGSYWIAVYDDAAGGGALAPTVYGPAPGPPICFRHEQSSDRFTFLQDRNLVTMTAP